MTPPCKNCPDRTPGCHARCAKYAEFASAKEEERKRRMLAGVHADGAKNTQTKMLKKKR